MAAARILFLLHLALLVTSARAQTPQTLNLFSDFAPGWRDLWSERKFSKNKTAYTYQPATHNTPQLLLAHSQSANSGLYREIKLTKPVAPTLTWRWRLHSALENNLGERTRPGDDYAARVWVIFESSIIPLRTRALCYVWSAHEPVGSMYANPWSSAIGTFIIRSGPRDMHQWLDETRNLEADYKAFFGEAPRRIDAVGLMVDTDNTGGSAIAAFVDLRLTTSTP